VQQSLPQQVCPAVQVPFPALQGGWVQLPSSQNGADFPHPFPQPPQLWGSFIGSTHWSLQHERPAVHAMVQGLPPELLVEPLLLPPPEPLPPLPEPELLALPLLLDPAPLLEPLPLLLPAPPLEVPPELPEPPELVEPPLPDASPWVASVEASPPPLPSGVAAPPHQDVTSTRPARPASAVTAGSKDRMTTSRIPQSWAKTRAMSKSAVLIHLAHTARLHHIARSR
jgi:hypothetical protein